METTVGLEPEAYRTAQSLVAERGQSLGKVLSDAVLAHHSGLRQGRFGVSRGTTGLPELRAGVPIDSDRIRAMIAEDEEWEIARGNPDRTGKGSNAGEVSEPSPGYPRVVEGPLGLPEVQIVPPIGPGEIRRSPEVEDYSTFSTRTS